MVYDDDSDEMDTGKMYGYGATSPVRHHRPVAIAYEYDDEDMLSVHSRASQRRASSRGNALPLPAQPMLLKKTSGYGTDSGGSDEDDNFRDRESRARSRRRASLKATRRASGGYGKGAHFPDAASGQRVSRRMSAGYAPPPRNASFGSSSKKKKSSRRASLSGPMHSGANFDDPAFTRSGRRASFSRDMDGFDGAPPPRNFQPLKPQSRHDPYRGNPPPHEVRTSKGINADALARMAASGANQSSDEDEEESYQSRNQGAAYGYGYGGAANYGGQPTGRVSRRPSSSSQASRSSQRSRRRNSYLARQQAQSSDPLVNFEIGGGAQLAPESDLDESEDEGSAMGYGYGAPASRAPAPTGMGYESDAAGSQRSSRSRRRNSCIIRPDNMDPTIATEISSGAQLVPESDLENSDDEVPQSPMYGYGGGVPQAPQSQYGYESDAAGSQRSSRSRRPNSCIIRPDGTGIGASVDAENKQEVFANSANPSVPSSHLSPNSDHTAGTNKFGYGFGLPSGGADYMTDDDASQRSEDISVMSCKRSKRRNSCLEGAEKDPLVAGLLGSASNAAPSHDDLNDPDSLLSRSGFYLNKNKQAKPKKSVGLGVHRDSEGSEHEDELSFNAPEAPPKTKGVSRLGAVHTTSNTPIAQKTEESNEKEMTWSRSTPFTTAYTAPTEDQLQGPKKESTHSQGLKQSLHCNWGEMDIGSEPSADDSSEESFGASMYNDSKTYQEIDRYKQRARRRASMEAGCIDMATIIESPSKSLKKKITTMDEPQQNVPSFIPAEGCTNASDFIVRCFCARLRSGITVLKHNRGRWSKSQYRVLYLLPDGKTVSWKPVEGEKDKGKRPKLDLSLCKEVRHAWSRDTDTRKQNGTAVLRKQCKNENMIAKSLSLVFNKRTFDMTALSTDLCKVLLEGFSALCFRLQLERAEREESGDLTAGSHCGIDAGDDWASTVYGPESTVSLSITNTNASGVVPPISPWGL